jgi:hypothetical protein
MAFTTPGTAVAGEVLTAAFWNEQVRDNMTAVAGPPFARNLLYNGAMQVAQRGTSVASITTSAYYTADRWNISLTTLGTWTQSVENDAPTGSGFRKSTKMLCSTADASPAAGDLLVFQQTLEGQDLQRILKGTSSANPLTVTFWVKSNKTGTYIVELEDVDNTRHVNASYTISASSTWEQKTVTFPADTTGAFDNDIGASLRFNFWLGAGSTYTSGTLATTWASITNANRAAGQTNLAAATSNFWQVTGVQLETGSVATGFEFLPFGDELARCQRYYETSFANGITPGTDNLSVVNAGGFVMNSSTSAGGFVSFLVRKRTHSGAAGVWAPINTPSANKARRGYDGLTVAAAVGLVTETCLGIAITGGTSDLYQIGWAVSAEL